MEKTKHVPVLLQEVINILDIGPKSCFIDCTLGGAGHFLELLKKLNGQGKAIAFDQDEKAIARLVENLKLQGFEEVSRLGKKLTLKNGELQIELIHDNFSHISEWVKTSEVNAILVDLGLSTDQVEDESYGFSFLNDDSILDMRLDKQSQVRACDLLNGLYKKELERLFTELADVSFAKRLTNEIINKRAEAPITKAGELKAIIQRIVPFKLRRGANKHPEAKVFQALRIAVNQEFKNLQDFLPQAFETLSLGGKMAIISFHSGEDRIIKHYFKQLTLEKKARYEGDEKFIQATQKELDINSKSHSAKLRFITKN